APSEEALPWAPARSTSARRISFLRHPTSGFLPAGTATPHLRRNEPCRNQQTGPEQLTNAFLSGPKRARPVMASVCEKQRHFQRTLDTGLHTLPCRLGCPAVSGGVHW